MTRTTRDPERAWFLPAILAAALVAIASGYGCYRYSVRQHSMAALSDSARGELAGLTVTPRATAKIERSWISNAKDEYLIASNVPMPCAGPADAIAASQDPDPVARTERLEAIADAAPDNMIVALIHGTQLIEAGDYARAEQVLARTLDSTDMDESIINAAKSPTSTLDLSDPELSTVIHLHHALAVAQLSRGSANLSWKSLKNVIGSVKPLSSRRIPGTTRNQPTWSMLPVPAPGCSSSPDSLSTYDLYNNLIVGYMKGNFTGKEKEREKEFFRPGASTPLRTALNAQVQRTREANWQNESQLWALSNVEQVIDWRLPAVPDDARLAFNSVQVIDWWTKGEGKGIPELRDKLIEQMFRRRNVAADQRNAFARGALRMLASSGVNRTNIANDAAQVREWLSPQDALALDDFLAADAARSAMPKWLVTPEKDQERPEAKLGPRGEAWYSAALTDYAAAASQWAASRPVEEQRRAIVAIWQLLGRAAAPPELIALEKNHGWRSRAWMHLSSWKGFWMFVSALVAALVWLVLAWTLAHVRERRLLRTSLYNVEYEMLSKGPR